MPLNHNQMGCMLPLSYSIYSFYYLQHVDAGTWLYQKAVVIITSTQWQTGGTWKLRRVHFHIIISNWRADNQSSLTHKLFIYPPWSQKKCKICFRRNSCFVLKYIAINSFLCCLDNCSHFIWVSPIWTSVLQFCVWPNNYWWSSFSKQSSKLHHIS